MLRNPRILLAVGGALALALLAAVFLFGRSPEYRVLYSGLSDKDGGAVVAALTQLNVPYRFTEGGGAIMVPLERVHDTRLKLASQGLPRGSGVGFELMENQKFGATQFQERLNFQRGLEGELARSIQALAAVEGARVHLALPAQTAFFRDQQKPSASVLLQMHPGRTLDKLQVAGIVHLVASSVPDLNPRAVSIVDQTGMLLSGPEGATPGDSRDTQQLQYVRTLENQYVRRVLDIVEPFVGAGNVRAQVTADIDFTQTEATAEEYRPNQGDNPAAVRSQQTLEAAGAAAGPQGVPGAPSNTPVNPTGAPKPGQGVGTAQPVTPPGTGTGATGGRRESVTNYEVDKTVRVTRGATGTVRRLSAAVVVSHRKVTGPDGKETYQPLPAAQLEQINALVREAIGYSQDRGDSVNVAHAPFAPATAPGTDGSLPLWKDPEVLALGKSVLGQLGLVVLGVLLIMMVLRPALKAATKKDEPEAASTAEGAEGASADGDGVSISGPEAVGGGPTVQAVLGDEVALPAPEGTSPVIAGLAAARTPEEVIQIARSDPAMVADVVRSWIAGGEPA